MSRFSLNLHRLSKNHFLHLSCTTGAKISIFVDQILKIQVVVKARAILRCIDKADSYASGSTSNASKSCSKPSEEPFEPPGLEALYVSIRSPANGF